MVKYLLIFLLTTLISTLICIEFINDIIYFILIVAISGSIISLILFFKKGNINLLGVVGVLFLALITTYILFASISFIERNIAFAKVSSIPKESLKEFYKTQDIDEIPKESRYAWIGCFYRKIDVIPEHKFGYKDTKAVGWKHNSVSAYYNLNDDRFSGSYH